MNKAILFFAILFLCDYGFSQPAGYVNPKPTANQLVWQNNDFYLFAHFGPNTFTGLEWGKGTENADVFNPEHLDCDQWCRIAKAAGAVGIIITAKHHDGFCLWPSKFSTHTVKESKWRNGKGDVLKELSEACKKYGLKFGVYLSPWDRNHPAYGTPEYNDVFVGMLKEIFKNYGPVWELWWDGANGEGPNGKKQVYDFARYERVVRKLSPNTVIFSDVGPDARWCGNEKGFIGTTNWNTLNTAGFTPGAGAPSADTLNTGNIYGKHWIPAECDVSIRSGWFYHKREDSLVKTPDQLFEIYLKSVGRGANLLLNVPPDTDGLISSFDSAALMEFKKLRDESFRNNISKAGTGYFVSERKKIVDKKLNDGNSLTASSIARPFSQTLSIYFATPQKINCIILKENLANGQNCIRFKILISGKEKQFERVIEGSTIGHERILTFPETDAENISLKIIQQKGDTEISEIGAYLISPELAEK